jgi:hypothetical protein
MEFRLVTEKCTLQLEATVNEKKSIHSGKIGAINSKRTPIRVQHSGQKVLNKIIKKAADHIRTAAKTNDFEVLEKDPFTWGRFWLFTQQYPGAMFGLGSGINTQPFTIQTTILLIISTGFRFTKSTKSTDYNAH